MAAVPTEPAPPPRPPVSDEDRFRVFFARLPTGSPVEYDFAWFFQQFSKLLVWLYMRLVHGYVLRYHPALPRRRPYVVVMSHTSWLDVPALMVADPWDPPTAMIIKSETMRIPLLSWVLAQWGAIPVDRRGRDVGALRKIRRTFQQGRGICIAPSGTRSPDGRLGPFSPVLVRLIVQSDVDVIPVAIVGSYECLPKGSKRLRAGKVWLDSGPPVDLGDLRGKPVAGSDLEEAARRIRDAMNALLPEYMRSPADAPVLGHYVEPSPTMSR